MNIISKLYAQTDPQWKNELLGFNDDPRFNIGNYGCVITAFGNMLRFVTGNPMYTPKYMNDWGKAHNGFEPGGGLANWGAYLNLGFLTSHGETSSLATLNEWLKAPENFAIVEFQLPGNQHFCFAPYVGKMIDSEDGILKNIGTYPFVEARLYTAINAPTPVAVSVSAPAPAAPSGTVKVTAQPFLNLRTGPGSNYPLGSGKDDAGNTITNLPNGVTVKYVDAVPADPNSPIKGIWLKSTRGNYFSAKFTTYGSLTARLAALIPKKN